jgi:ABC-type polysaccharide/polyol phosphate transport system ATPase subunit
LILKTNNLKLTLNRKLILNSINLNIEKGDKIGLTGKNGSGKTVLLRTLAGIYPVQKDMLSSQIKFFFLSTPGTATSPRLKSRDNIKRILMFHNQNTFREEVFLDLCDHFELNDYIDHEFIRLSQGYRLRLQLIAFLMMDFQNLLIDEFFGFGDSVVQEKFQEVLKNKYRTVDSLVVASHNQKIIKTICNRIIKLDQGRIIEDYII